MAKPIGWQNFLGGFIGGTAGFLTFHWATPIIALVATFLGVTLGFGYKHLADTIKQAVKLANRLDERTRRAANESVDDETAKTDKDIGLAQTVAYALFVGYWVWIWSLIWGTHWNPSDGIVEGTLLASLFIFPFFLSMREGLRNDSAWHNWRDIAVIQARRRERIQELGFTRYMLGYFVRIHSAGMIYGLLGIIYLAFSAAFLFVPILLLAVTGSAVYIVMRIVTSPHLGQYGTTLLTTLITGTTSYLLLSPHVTHNWIVPVALAVGLLCGGLSVAVGHVIRRLEARYTFDRDTLLTNTSPRTWIENWKRLLSNVEDLPLIRTLHFGTCAIVEDGIHYQGM